MNIGKGKTKKTGWNTKADGSGASYAASELLTLSGDITLYAQWTRDGGSSDGSGSTNTDTDTDTDTDIDDTDTADNDSTAHNVYISGYEAGTFRPDGKVTRAEVAQMLYGIIGADDSGQGSGFIDVSNNNWYYAPVTYLTDTGIISGYENGEGAIVAAGKP